ncbi:hypothetical protein AR158_c814L [Paramecium bursaria Chlorella virus AR158]|uniref:hypothetical protein n=1 Tax=Paramecium bursaria Chlorella virus AR158 TaxID=380598 RepID=UPI00015AA932|nr:hypothetical protein AR158_c814L [Paramecium bursaria Chlorella virus AR158]ABU44359.1 hypothetical protein AR158_c814L [Paramecium bursaria Chlorella virus AR158]
MWYIKLYTISRRVCRYGVYGLVSTNFCLMVYGKSLRSPRCHLLSERYPSLIRQIAKIVYGLVSTNFCLMVYGKSLRSPRCHLLSERYPSLIRQIAKVASVSSAIGTLSEPSLVYKVMYELKKNLSIQHTTFLVSVLNHILVQN